MKLNKMEVKEVPRTLPEDVRVREVWIDLGVNLLLALRELEDRRDEDPDSVDLITKQLWGAQQETVQNILDITIGDYEFLKTSAPIPQSVTVNP